MKRITLLILVLVSLTLIINSSCQNDEATAQLEEYKAELQNLEDNKALAERWHTDLGIDRNWEVAEEILAPDIIIHMPGGGEVKGIDEAKGFDAMYAAMENAKINHYEVVAEGDYVFLRWDLSFDNTIDFMGIPATGKRITDVGGIDQFLIENGKIKEFWQFFDELGFMKKLGAIPSE
ncbi:MAG: ester cyclase [Bacteroidales bacterium]